MIDLETAEHIALAEAGSPETRAVVMATERDVLVATGPDAATYLQGQISQDAEGLAVGGTSWTLLLQPQGKVDAWLRMHRLSEQQFLLDVDPGFGAAAQARLDRFKLRVDVEITVTTVAMLAVRGPGSAAVADAADRDPGARELGARDAGAGETGNAESGDADAGLLVLDASWGGVQGVDVVRTGDLFSADASARRPLDPAAVLAGPMADGTVVSAPDELLATVRVLQGLPTMGRELDESTIPAAARIVDQSVDFTKGCYVGQELVARIDSRGNNTPTRLVGVRFEGASVPAVGGSLVLDGATAGTVTSVARSVSAGSVGLAYLKRAVATPATLEFESETGQPGQARVVDLPAQPA